MADGKDILYIEDEEDYQLLVRRILGRAGFNVRTAATLADGFAALRAQAPDLLILDINLPDGDGYTVCRQLRDDAAFGDLPVLMLTVRRRPEEWLRGFSSGATDYISKPINPPELIERVMDNLRGPARRALDTASPEYQLLQAAVSGNRSAFQVMIEQYRDRLIAGLLASTRDLLEAEEIASRTFAVAFEKMAQFRGEAAFFTWIYRIALRELARHRETQRCISIESLGSARDAVVPHSLMEKVAEMEDWERADLLSRAKAALAKVPNPFRRALELYFLKDLSYEEIARRLKIPIGTVMSRLHKGRRLLVRDDRLRVEA